MLSLLRTLLTCGSLIAIGTAQAQWTLDPTFSGFTGTVGWVNSLLIQPDGKILIGGGFDTCNGTARHNVARLHFDGSLDTTFNPGMGSNGYVWILAEQPDGKILVGGSFTTFDSVPRNNIARLNEDGSVDETFDPGAGTDSVIHIIMIQPDGNFLIGGPFAHYDGIDRSHVARIHGDGSLDTSFDPGTGATGLNSSLETIALQPDGKILIGGNFIAYNDTARKSFARLHSNGALDLDLDPGIGPNNFVGITVAQPDGNILIAGDFTTYGGVPRSRMARMMSDGTLDTTFDPGAGSNGIIFTTALQSDGKVWVGGSFTTCDDEPHSRIARMNGDGSLDAEFGLDAGPNSGVWIIKVLPDGKIMMAGQFNTVDGMPMGHVARLMPDISTGIDPDPMPLVLRAVPDPATTTMRIAGLQGPFHWSVTDAQGRQLLRGYTGDISEEDFAISTLATGTYLISVQDGTSRHGIRFHKW